MENADRARVLDQPFVVLGAEMTWSDYAGGDVVLGGHGARPDGIEVWVAHYATPIEGTVHTWLVTLGECRSDTAIKQSGACLADAVSDLRVELELVRSLASKVLGDAVSS